MVAAYVSGQCDDDVHIALLRQACGIQRLEYDAARISRHSQLLDDDSRWRCHDRIMRRKLARWEHRREL
jgi:hypothetical protein